MRVNGMDPQALQRVLALSEDEKIGVQAKDVDAALGRELDRAPFRSAGETMFDAALASGVLRLSPRTAVSDGAARTSYQVAFDTRRLSLDLQADISHASTPRGWNGPAPQIGVSVSGLLAAPARRIESGGFVASLGARAVQREADHIEALEYDIKERAFFNRRLKWDRARQEERDRTAAEAARAEQERILQERRAAEAAETARRRAESPPATPIIPPFANAPPVLRPRPAVPLPPIAPYFRAPTANQDPSAAGRY
ncbi:MAG: hypothetical protein NVS2B5_28720 [Beijerinckiaceae bacterium]